MIQVVAFLLLVMCQQCHSEKLTGEQESTFPAGIAADRELGHHSHDKHDEDDSSKHKDKHEQEAPLLDVGILPVSMATKAPETQPPVAVNVKKDIGKNKTSIIVPPAPSNDDTLHLNVVPGKPLQAADDDDNHNPEIQEGSNSANIPAPPQVGGTTDVTDDDLVPITQSGDDDNTVLPNATAILKSHPHPVADDDQPPKTSPVTPTKAPKHKADAPKTEAPVRIIYKTFAPSAPPRTEAPVRIVYKTLAPTKPKRHVSLAPVVPKTDAPVVPKTASPTQAPTHAPTHAPVAPLTPDPVPTKGNAKESSEDDKLPAYKPLEDDPISEGVDLTIKDEEMELAHVEKEAETAGGLGFLLAMLAMVFTAYQMSENPDGIFASVCRLAITLLGCGFKMITMPCRNFLGNRYHAGHVPVSTMEYREPYRGSGNMMEMT